MGVSNHRKISEIGSEEKSPENLVTPEKQIPLETKEVLEPEEREKLRQEVLQGIEQTEKPAKKFSIKRKKRKVKKSKIKEKTVEPVGKSQELIKIEAILEKDLEDVYILMNPKLKQEFKKTGEETAQKIEEILSKAKVKTGNIFKLIFKWLKMIPGVNKFFLKQEAKIKTDQIIKTKG